MTRKLPRSISELDAYLYIRQSTPRQVVENHGKHSTPICSARSRRVAGLAASNVSTYWTATFGKSGSQPAGRDGFQKLVSEVALGKAGLVM